ncbi:cation diffusion facilitator family transporter [Kroppenstedtia guangzhouensis]
MLRTVSVFKKLPQGGLGFTWSVFGSLEQRKRKVKPNPDRPGMI